MGEMTRRGSNPYENLPVYSTAFPCLPAKAAELGQELDPSLACPSSREMLAKATESKFCFQLLLSNLVMNEVPQKFMDCMGRRDNLQLLYDDG